MNRVGRTKDVITLKSWIRQRSVPIDLFRTSCFNVEPHLVIKKLQAQWFGHVADHNVPRKFGGSSLAGWESDAEADTRLGDVLHPRLAWSRLGVEIAESSEGKT